MRQVASAVFMVLLVVNLGLAQDAGTGATEKRDKKRATASQNVSAQLLQMQKSIDAQQQQIQQLMQQLQNRDQQVQQLQQQMNQVQATQAQQNADTAAAQSTQQQQDVGAVLAVACALTQLLKMSLEETR